MAGSTQLERWRPRFYAWLGTAGLLSLDNFSFKISSKGGSLHLPHRVVQTLDKLRKILSIQPGTYQPTRHNRSCSHKASSSFTTHRSPSVRKEAEHPTPGAEAAPTPAGAASLCAQMSARPEAAGPESRGSSPNLVTREHRWGRCVHVLPPKARRGSPAYGTG